MGRQTAGPELLRTRPERATPSTLDPDSWYKVEPGLLKAGLTGGREPLSFIVFLQDAVEPARLPQAAGRASEPDRSTRREAIVSTLQRAAERSQAAVKAYLEAERASGHVQRYTPFWIFNGLAVTADAHTLFSLAGRPEVKIIRADRKLWLNDAEGVPSAPAAPPVPPSSPAPAPTATQWNLSKIRADLVHSSLGVDGAGIVVGSMDTGVDGQHPALAPRYRGYNPKGLPNHLGNWFSVTDEDYRYPGDGNGHGTHTTGIVLGEGVGVAPGAQWIAVKVFHNQGYTVDSWLHAGFQWLLAPGGDPTRAPDVINASWGTDISTDESFRGDIAALRAAGIAIVFSAGNSGPEAGTIGAPASYPESFSVGAADADDDVPSFSSRGPSPFGATKPEVVAPGVNVLSTEPGGGYGKRSGTSMAAPHVAGLAALLLQADPALDITSTQEIITRTAVPLRDPPPNNESGWGRIDAYAAVASVAEVGFIEGRVTRISDGVPIAEASVSVQLRDQPAFVQIRTDSTGWYRLALSPGTYDVRVAAFGYLPATQLAVKVVLHQTVGLDVALDLAPAGAFYGRVTDADTGAPLSATLRLADTPVAAVTDPRTGLYSLSLPPGSYTVTVASARHRVGRAVVTVELDQARSLDFALKPAPSILLVDSGAWYFNSQAGYFQQTLDALDYVYDVWRVKQLPSGVPQPSTLAPYDIVLWSAPQDAPGFIGASRALTTYLESGGRLLITGQDVGYWDGGGTGTFSASYFREYLHAAFVKDSSGVPSVSGLTGGPLAGLSLGLGGGDASPGPQFPDVVEPWPPGESAPIADYSGTDQHAGLAVDVCVPYRALYLAFGLEGINSQAMRETVLSRAFDYLMSSPVDVDFRLSSARTKQVSAPDRVITYTFTVRNTGREADSFSLNLGEHNLPTSLWDETFTYPLEGKVTIPRCESRRLGVKVEVPAGLAWNVRDAVQLVVSSERAANAGTPLTRTLSLETKTPAPVLLVDDDRWYNQEVAYEAGLSANGLAFDLWDMGGGRTQGTQPLTLDEIGLYPLVIWFTGYDWYDTLSASEEQMLARYLDRGGRLVFSSQDYLYTNGVTPFAADYLGVLTYTEDVTATRLDGVAGNPVGDGLGPFPLDFPFANHADALVPQSVAAAAFTGDQHQVVAVTRDALSPSVLWKGYRTLFAAAPLETMRPADAAVFWHRVFNWLAPLAGSSLQVSRPVAAAGERITCELRIRNSSRWSLPAVRLSSPLPPGPELVTDSLQGADYSAAERMLGWHDSLAPGAVHTVTFQLDLPSQVTPGTSFTLLAAIEDGIGLRIDRQVVVRVNVPDLTTSRKRAEPAVARPGDVVTYSLEVRNTGTFDAASVVLSDTLPSGLVYQPDSLFFSAGHGEVIDNVLRWNGPVGRRGLVLLTYAGRIAPEQRTPLVNTAMVRDEFGAQIRLEAAVRVPNHVYLPVIRVSR